MLPDELMRSKNNGNDKDNFNMHHMWPIFQSKKGLKDHKDKNHRMTNSKIVKKMQGFIVFKSDYDRT